MQLMQLNVSSLTHFYPKETSDISPEDCIINKIREMYDEPEWEFEEENIAPSIDANNDNLIVTETKQRVLKRNEDWINKMREINDEDETECEFEEENIAPSINPNNDNLIVTETKQRVLKRNEDVSSNAEEITKNLKH